MEEKRREEKSPLQVLGLTLNLCDTGKTWEYRRVLHREGGQTG